MSAPYFGYFKYASKDKEPEKTGLLPFETLNQLFVWFTACTAEEKLMLKNIAVSIQATEIGQTSQEIEVVHGAPQEERLSEPPQPQVPGEPVVGTPEAAEVPKDA